MRPPAEEEEKEPSTARGKGRTLKSKKLSSLTDREVSERELEGQEASRG